MVYQRVIPSLDYSLATTSFCTIRSYGIHIYVYQYILPTVDHSRGEPQRCKGGHVMGLPTAILGGGILSPNLSSLFVMLICMSIVEFRGRNSLLVGVNVTPGIFIDCIIS